MTPPPAVCGTGYGLTIASTLALPGLAAVGDVPGRVPDISIYCAVLPALVDTPANGPYCLTDDGLLFTAPGVGRYLARAGRALLVDADPAADPEAVSGLLIATALPMLLWQRGGVLLHAACVTLPGGRGAIAIAGASGSGKSTLAAALLEAGADLVADDSCWLRSEAGMVISSGLPGGLFRRDQAGDGRQFMAVPPAQQRLSAPLAGILVIDDAGPAAGIRHPLAREAALTALLRHRHRPRIPAMLGQEADVFRACVLHSGHVPTYGWCLKDDERPGSRQEIIDFVMSLSTSHGDRQ